MLKTSGRLAHVLRTPTRPASQRVNQPTSPVVGWDVISDLHGAVPTVDVGEHTSVAIGINGNPVISYFDSTNFAVSVATCNDPACLLHPTVRSVGTGADSGRFNSIVTTSTGNPTITYFDRTNEDLKVASCDHPTCASVTVNVLDLSPQVGGYTSVILGVDAKPVVSYYDRTNGIVKVTVCGNTTCDTYRPGE